MITRAYLHGGEARCHVFLITDGRLVDFHHPPLEVFFSFPSADIVAYACLTSLFFCFVMLSLTLVIIVE